MDSSILTYGAIGIGSLLLYLYFNSNTNKREKERNEKIQVGQKTQLEHYEEMTRKQVERNEKDFLIIIDNSVYNLQRVLKQDQFQPFIGKKGQDVTEEFFEIEGYSTLFKEIEDLKIGEVPKNEKIKRKRKIKNYTKKQVLEHNSYEDAWIIINGKVYDVTEYTPEHPGGDLILTKVGQDSTADYLAAKHPSYVEDLLQDFYIGDAKE